MKKALKLMLLTVVLLNFTACSKDENEKQTESSSKIEGKWMYYKVASFPNGIEDENAYNDYHNSCNTNHNYKEILANGIYNEVSFDYECVNSNHNATWTKVDNFITFNSPVGNDYNKYEILFLDDNTLKVKLIESCCTENKASVTHTIFKRINNE